MYDDSAILAIFNSALRTHRTKTPRITGEASTGGLSRIHESQLTQCSPIGMMEKPHCSWLPGMTTWRCSACCESGGHRRLVRC